jgi:hypothetical protein
MEQNDSIAKAFSAREEADRLKRAERQKKYDEYGRKVAERIAGRAIKAAEKGEAILTIKGGPLGVRDTVHDASIYSTVAEIFNERSLDLDFAVTRDFTASGSFMTPLGEWHTAPKEYHQLSFMAIAGQPVNAALRRQHPENQVYPPVK